MDIGIHQILEWEDQGEALITLDGAPKADRAAFQRRLEELSSISLNYVLRDGELVAVPVCIANGPIPRRKKEREAVEAFVRNNEKKLRSLIRNSEYQVCVRAKRRYICRVEPK